MRRLRLAILISGRGSNLAAILAACDSPEFPAEVAVVVSNRATAPGLDVARAAGAPALVIDQTKFGPRADARAAFESELDAALARHDADFICLAGFMRLLSAPFVERWLGRIVNIHPSLLPAFKGLDVHARTLASGVRIAGCSVHFVTPEMDAGPIIGQAAVPVFAGDDVRALAKRILAEEHVLYPACIRLIGEGRARYDRNEGVVFAAGIPAGARLRNPEPGTSPS